MRFEQAVAGRFAQAEIGAAALSLRVLHRLGGPVHGLAAFLGAYLHSLATLSGVAGGELRVAGLGRLTIRRAAGGLVADWREDGACAGPDAAAGIAVPLTYGEGSLGELVLRWDDNRRTDPGQVRDCARHIAFMIKRCEVGRWTAERLGRPLLLVGVSPAARDLDLYVEKAAQSDLPALLHGEFGTETPYLAAAIHCCGQRRDGPFVQVDCAQPAGGPEDWFRQAAGGTLFLSNIDTLAPGLQYLVPQRMQSRLGQWLDGSGRDVPAAATVRVVASATADLRRLVLAGRFSRPLLAELDFLSVTVPPLRDRPQDIEPLVAATLERHGFCAAAKAGPELLALCRSHSWPENVFELERVVARLAVMTGREAIRAEDVRRHVPQILGEAGPAPAAAGAAAEGAPAGEEEGDGGWVRGALGKDPRVLGRLHPNLRKAVLYLADHYAEPIRLAALARQAHVSQSHLSFLFRHGMQLSCKTLLARIRVEKAKEMLAGDPRQPVTEVALRVGFSDLSHFEKCFRREVGLTPREYRRAAAAGAVGAIG